MTEEKCSYLKDEDYQKSVLYFMTEMTQKEFENLGVSIEKGSFKFDKINLENND